MKNPSPIALVAVAAWCASVALPPHSVPAASPAAGPPDAPATVRPAPGSNAPAAAPYRSPAVAAANPKAPAETAQFAFLVGAWDCTTRFLGRDGKTFNEGTATWSGEFILDGWAIQDWWTSDGPNGRSHGTNIRSFNPQTGKWDNRWLATGSLQWQYFEAEQKGDTMVMQGGEGTGPRGPFIDRNTFYDITADHWMWRKDRSWDGGETWFEGVGFIEATRRK